MGHCGQALVWITLALVWTASAHTRPTQTFDFEWSPDNNSLSRCGNIDLEWQTRHSSAVGPYTLIVYRPEQAPYRLNAGTGSHYPWHVNLNPGGPYLILMEDGRGADGGVSDPFYVHTGLHTCSNSGENPQTLSLNLLTTEFVTCGVVSASIARGLPPYTLKIIPAAQPPRTMVFSSERVNIVLDLPPGVQTMFSVEDAAGRGAVSQMFKVQPSSDLSCLNPGLILAPRSDGPAPPHATHTSLAPTPSESAQVDSDKSNNVLLPAIVGSIIGGFSAIGFAILLTIYWRRRKRGYFEQPHPTKERETKNPATSSSAPSPNPSPQPSVHNKPRRSPVPHQHRSSHLRPSDGPALGGGALGVGFEADDLPIASSSKTPPAHRPFRSSRHSGTPILGGGTLGIGFDNDDLAVASCSKTPPAPHGSRSSPYSDAPNLGGGGLGISFDTDDSPIAGSSNTPSRPVPSTERRSIAFDEPWNVV